MYLSDGKAPVVVVVVVVPVPPCYCVGTYHSPTPESWMFFDVGERAPSPMADHLHEMEEAAASYLGQVRARRVLNVLYIMADHRVLPRLFLKYSFLFSAAG